MIMGDDFKIVVIVWTAVKETAVASDCGNSERGLLRPSMIHIDPEIGPMIPCKRAAF